MLAAVGRAQQAGLAPPAPAYSLERTQTRQESLASSLLSQMGSSASPAELREAYCRHVHLIKCHISLLYSVLNYM